MGSSHLVTDSLGNVLREESRYPYGLERQVNGEGSTVNGESIAVDYVYTGKEYDTETGLIYFGGRYYAPELGRWITPDPLFLEKELGKTVERPLSSNLYAYVRNNPMTLTDSTGWIEDERDMFPGTFADESVALTPNNAGDRLLARLVFDSMALLAVIPAFVKSMPAIVSTAIIHPEAAMAFVEGAISNFLEPVQPPIPKSDPYVYAAGMAGSQLGAALRNEYDLVVEDYNSVFDSIDMSYAEVVEVDNFNMTE